MADEFSGFTAELEFETNAQADDARVALQDADPSEITVQIDESGRRPIPMPCRFKLLVDGTCVHEVIHA